VDRGAVSVAIEPVVSAGVLAALGDMLVVVEQPPALSAAKTATEARRRAGGRCIVRQTLNGKRGGMRRRPGLSNKTLTLMSG
jgi:hypothetical protein